MNNDGSWQTSLGIQISRRVLYFIKKKLPRSVTFHEYFTKNVKYVRLKVICVYVIFESRFFDNFPLFYIKLLFFFLLLLLSHLSS